MSLSQAQGLGTWNGINPSLRTVIDSSLDLEISSPLRASISDPQGTHDEQRVFAGRFAIPALNCRVPEQTFIEDRNGSDIILRNTPTGKWPSVIIVISHDSPVSPIFKEMKIH